MNIIERQKLKTILGEVINGYSPFKTNGKVIIFFKHSDFYVSSLVDEIYEEAYNKAIDSGLITTELRLKELKIQNLWTDGEEDRIQEQKAFLQRFKITKSKVFKKRDVEEIEKEISKTEQEIFDLESRKLNLIGFTAEAYASRRSNYFFTFISLYKDKELHTPFYSMEEFEELEEREINEVFEFYEKYTFRLNPINLKKIAVSPFFLNSYYLCEDNPFIFYGKSVVNLTFNQMELFSYGRYFKHILAEVGDLPPHVENDPDKIIELFEARKNAKDFMDKNKVGGNTNLVGLSKEDRERLGLEQEKGVSLASLINKKGGKLTMEEMLKIEGQ